MASYEKFAEVYDTFMQNIPYDKWTEHLKKIWKKYGLEPELVAELGCGTGNMTIRLAKDGYDMIGIDLSEQMLDKAREKTQAAGLDILYLNQDMTEFELYGTVQSVICLCDSINYITDKEELLEVFRLVNNYLDPKGLFIFDINTVYKFREVLANNSFCETTENSAYTWENYYDEDERINEFYTNFFIKDEKTGKYDRYEEYHYERAYEISDIIGLIEEAGLEFLGVFDELSFFPPEEDSQRIYFVAREVTK